MSSRNQLGQLERVELADERGLDAHGQAVLVGALAQTLGELTVSDGSDVIVKVPLVAQAAVPEGGWWTRMVDGIALWME